MNLTFDTTISKLSIKSSNDFKENNYVLEVNLTLVHYHFDEDDDFEQKTRLDGYLKKLLKTYYANIEIISGGESNFINFKENFINISSKMNEDKLLRLYEVLKDKEVKTKFLRIELTPIELKTLFDRKEFNDSITLWNIFNSIEFQFQYV
ncbi:hypothetical protein G6685_07470 [Polynucleobacter paneuropaeus]|jgi:hypothetical protein|nr:hypothetical protein [Polynucleobacter paneuropaeus]